MKEDKTLYVSDLDGTLLTTGIVLSDFTRDSLNSLIGRGMLFTYATARSHSSASRILKGLELRLPVITYNGAAIVEPDTGAPVRRYLISADEAFPFRELLMQERAPVLTTAFVDGRERMTWMRGMENEGIRNYQSSRQGDARLRCVDTWEELFAGELLYITLIGGREELDPIREKMGGLSGFQVGLQEDIYTPGEWWMDIQAAGVSKAAAISVLAGDLDVQKVVCFGDHLNDLSMFRTSGEGYAVANAQPALKEAATAVIGGNDSDGVARWLLEHAKLPEQPAVNV